MIKKFEAFGMRQITFVSKRNQSQIIKVFTEGGRIVSIENESGVR